MHDIARALLYPQSYGTVHLKNIILQLLRNNDFKTQ